jgi:hypothetical protein
MRPIRIALIALLVAAAVPAGAAEQQTASADGAATCSCRACDQVACCRTPTGFAPLDEKCRTLCRQQTWTPAAGEACGAAQPKSCCPTAK